MVSKIGLSSDYISSNYKSKNKNSMNFQGATGSIQQFAKKSLGDVFKMAEKNPSLFEGAFVFGLSTTLRPAAIMATPAKKADKQYASSWAIATGVIGLVLSIVIFKPLAKRMRNVTVGAAKKQSKTFIKAMNESKTTKELSKNIFTSGRVTKELYIESMNNSAKYKKKLIDIAKELDGKEAKEMNKAIKEAPSYNVLADVVKDLESKLGSKAIGKKLKAKINKNLEINNLKREAESILVAHSNQIDFVNITDKIIKDGKLTNKMANQILKLVKKGKIQLSAETPILNELIKTEKVYEKGVEQVNINLVKNLKHFKASDVSKELKSFIYDDAKRAIDSKRMSKFLEDAASKCKIKESNATWAEGTQGGDIFNYIINYGSKFVVAPIQAWALMTLVKPIVKKVFKRGQQPISPVQNNRAHLSMQQQKLFKSFSKGGLT